MTGSVGRAHGDRTPGRARFGWTVRQLLGWVLFSSVASMLIVGAIGSLAVHESTETVDTLSQELGPAQVSNAEFMEAMLDAETELRAYLISGQLQQLTDHHAALARAPRAEADLRHYVAGHPALAGLVRRQEHLARSWRAFAARAITKGPRTADDDLPLFDEGVRRFDAIKAVNLEVSQRLAGQVDAARSAAQSRLDATVTLIALIGVAGAGLCGLVGWWVMRTIRRPLSSLEDVVDRLGAGEVEARAPITGPTEIRRLARAVNEMAEENASSRAMEQVVTERLLDADRVKSEFVANVSHELRTPLTSIDGYLELLAEDLDGEVGQEHTQMLTVMQRNVVRLRALIEDLLDLGRVERRPGDLQPVDVASVVRTVAEDLRLAAGSREVTISVDVEDSPAVVRADATQLQRALTNLISNAVKFSHAGGDVRLHLGASEREVELTVTDTGIGIPGADQRKLGERFFRASNAVEAHIPGTGLGLRMVQAIVNNHHGYFGVTSREGQGTTATVRLPVQRESTSDGPEQRPEQEQSVPLPR
jgi:signal transduction histidine kinase